MLAGIISKLTGCDVHQIQATETCSDDYDDTPARNGEFDSMKDVRA